PGPLPVLRATDELSLSPAVGEADAIGQTMAMPKFRYKLANGTDATVIGVVADVKYSGISAAASDQVYIPLAQMPWLSTFLAVRMDTNATLRRRCAGWSRPSIRP